MRNLLLRPKWIALHVACIAAIVVMINLALWQLGRLDEREALNERVASRSAAAIVPLADVALTDPEAVEYQRVEVSGTYVGPQFLMVNLSQDGVTGSDPVNALQLADGSHILVNRGFLPFDARLVEPPFGEVTLIGRLRQAQVGGTDQRATDATPDVIEIRRIDVAAIGEQLDGPVVPMYLDLIESFPTDTPVLQQVPLPAASSGPHLSYAIQWFLFTGCVAAGWGIAVRRGLRAQE